MHTEYELKVTFEGTFVLVISNGDKSYETAHKMWSMIAETCKQHNCYKVLGLANSTKTFSTMEGYEHGDLFDEIGINYRYKIAWFELNPDSLEQLMFIETVLVNRGKIAKVFTDVDQAKAWLLAD
ncbi:MAG: hypothetical protein K9J17_02860 [Flavobacteriales bacterium]|nr:hypothetical protein [Flavobacteriales bacterium]